MGSAPEWRQDPLTDRLVLISPDRGERPHSKGPACPFCEGHESETPPEVLAFRAPGSAPNGPGWRIRVVPNRYAAVRLDAGLGEPPALAGGVNAKTPPANAGGSPFPVPGVGVAEVFIECPHHESKLRNLSAEHVAVVLRAWRDRLRFWQDDGRLKFVQIFRNEGPSAGASVEHCHSQLIGVDLVPQRIAEELKHLRHLRDFAGLCPYCRWVEKGRGHPCFVLETPRFAAFCPPAPRFPGETWLLPKFHIHAFDALADDKLLELAATLTDLLTRIGRVFGDPDFNLILKLSPIPIQDAHHWRIEVLPRTTTTAGWEWGTGLMINTVFPEHAAKLLRGLASSPSCVRVLK